MKQIVKQVQKKESENRLGVLRLELDYELATLFEAMEEKNNEKVNECKKKLERLRKEWLRLQA
ncbi:hypothetical protein [Metabacillus arenae]|uniref:hypothetical protein n=1 Tax=Metabacillus arenae TaxID=2771434 RepID=UPI001CD08C49|nr:hypothetical protein [Metabacillus arenae]